MEASPLNDESVVNDVPLAPSSSPVVRVVSCDRVSHVHALNLKFDGKGSVHAFIERLEELTVSRNISPTKLFNSAAELFSDEALCWYRSVRDEVSDWTSLKNLLLEDFLPHDFDYRLLQEIRSRTQGSDESIIQYLSIMHNYFARLRRPLSDAEKLEIVQYNVRPFYTTQLALVDCSTWADFKKRCRQLEAAKQRAELFVEPRTNSGSAVSPDLTYKGKGSRKIEAVVAEVKKFCVRCRKDGHNLAECEAPPILVCYKCGEKGVTTRTCSRCAPAKN